jgi:hypothetical protein
MDSLAIGNEGTALTLTFSEAYLMVMEVLL